MSQTVLIVDDEREVVDLLKLYIENEGYNVLEAFDGKEALELARKHAIHLIVLDIMMPDCDGLQVVKELRQSLSVPVIFLSARVQDHDKILGLNLGADDYMTKPFNPLEVVARIQAQLRRYQYLHTECAVVSEVLEIGSLMLDKAGCQLHKNGRLITLTSIEYKLLLHFMENPGRVFTKRQLLDRVWQQWFGDDNTLLVYISKLRDKIEDDPRKPVYLTTIRGLGYRFEKK
ncbi:response regulator transcription factor [Paenibacillus graminis]|uniref:PhoP family transcriptional regulator n=1 Tax=Paenibacillus graminis TaxID=189425 RepID=A0A089M9A8_9BACL|nr:response regulator transcription factor [Paenibacillus graminis]AIQ68910.1 PhoP family transcriptional regulator [Paenibacillus graminis]MEC0167030.1 response regulator transcription factor [Paenibacillus graminis]